MWALLLAVPAGSLLYNPRCHKSLFEASAQVHCLWPSNRCCKLDCNRFGIFGKRVFRKHRWKYGVTLTGIKWLWWSLMKTRNDFEMNSWDYIMTSDKIRFFLQAAHQKNQKPKVQESEMTSGWHVVDLSWSTKSRATVCLRCLQLREVLGLLGEAILISPCSFAALVLDPLNLPGSRSKHKGNRMKFKRTSWESWEYSPRIQLADYL